MKKGRKKAKKMEIKTEKQEKFKKIPDGYTSVQVYIAKDGVKFYTEKECIAYEKKIKDEMDLKWATDIVNSMETKDVDFPFDDFPTEWFHVVTDDDSIALKIFWGMGKKYANWKRNDFSIDENTFTFAPGWYGMNYESYSGDYNYKDDGYIYSLSFIRSTFTEFLEEFDHE